MSVTEEDAERALDYMRDNADIAAQAHADRVYMTEYRKSLKAILMTERQLDPLGVQERYAYSHQRYLNHLEALKIAVFQDKRQEYLMKAAEAKKEFWRSVNKNQREAKI